MKITEYGKVTSIDENTVFLLDGDQGTKTVLATDLIKAVAEISDPKLHRMIYGGRYLGESVTEEQKAVIRDGTFKGMLVGDYWTINKVNWRIADIDYWLRCGDVELQSHHLMMIPEKSLYAAKMNDTADTTGAYVGSKMYTTYLEEAKTKINTAFPNLVLTRKECLANTMNDGYQSNGGWTETTVELMNEVMVYGCHIFAPMPSGTVTPYNYTVGKQQLAIFALNPEMVNIRENYWLRDVVSASGFAFVDVLGVADWHAATTSLGVRPVFAIG